MALPILFAQIGEEAIQFTDTALLGRIGSAELAAIGLVEALLGVGVVPAVGLNGAMQILVARRTGQARHDEIVSTFNRTLRLVVPTMIGVALVLRLGTAAYADRFIQSDAVARAVTDFFRFGALGIVVFAVNLTYTSLYLGIGRTRILVAATALMVSANFGITYVLLFGLLGAPRLGMEGAGIGFTVAEVLTFAFIALRAGRQLHVGGRGLFSRRVPDGASAARLARLGWPISGQLLIETLRWVAFLLIVGEIGEAALAASSMVYACYGVLLIPAVAFTETAYSFISNLIGRDEERRIPTLMRALVTRAYAITLPLAGFVALWPDAALSIFTSDPATIALAVGPLRVVLLVMLVVIPAEMWFAAVFGTADTAAGSAIELVASMVMLAAAYLVGIVIGLELTYVWATLGIAAALTLAASYARIQSGTWKAQEW